MVPAAGRLLDGADLALTESTLSSLVGGDWPADLTRVIYVDRFGNLITGMRAPRGRPSDYRLDVGQAPIHWARTFCELPVGQPFWYEDAFGLVEIAVSRGRADVALGLQAGDPLGPLVTC